MVFIPGMRTEARRVNPGLLLEMFDSSWRVRNIWDGVRLEVVEDRSPVVLHSFTHLDPDLPLLEVSQGGGGHGGGGGGGDRGRGAGRRCGLLWCDQDDGVSVGAHRLMIRNELICAMIE